MSDKIEFIIHLLANQNNVMLESVSMTLSQHYLMSEVPT